MVQSNESLFLGYPKNILILCQAWLWHENGLLSKVYMLLVVIMQYVNVIFEIVCICQVWGDAVAVSEASFLLFSLTAACVKATVFLFNQKLLVILLDTMKSEVFELQNQKILKAASQNTRKLGAFLLSCTLLTATLYVVMPLIDHAGVKVFPLKMWMPVSPESSPGYELGYLYQVVSIYIGAVFFSVIDVLIFCMIVFGCAQIDVTLHILEQVQSIPVNVKKRKDRDEIMEKNNQLLVECIRRHQAVAGFIKNIENAYHSNILFQLSGTVGLICIIGFRITLMDPKSMQFFFTCTFMVSILMQVFLYCWAGNKITEKSENLRDQLYLCPWYEQDIRYRRTMLIAMECMKKPILFRAGHYVPLSKPSFVSILRASYSYFAVLKRQGHNVFNSK